MIVFFFQPVLVCLQFHNIDNSEHHLCFSLPRCDFGSIEYALNTVSLYLCDGIVSGTSTNKTLAGCLVCGTETLLEKDREAA